MDGRLTSDRWWGKMPDHPRLSEAEGHFRAFCKALGADPGAGEWYRLSPAWAALVDFARTKGGYATIHDLRFLAGDPVVGDHELSPAVSVKIRFSAGPKHQSSD
jgi:hypothetical protein